MPTRTTNEINHNGITVAVKEITGLQRVYYALDVLGIEIHGSRALRTMSTANKEMVYKINASLVTQIHSGVGFWDLKFKTVLTR